MEKIRNRIIFILQLILGILICLMIVTNFIQMVTRYFISVTVAWVEDFSVLGLYWLFGLGVPMAWLMGKHMEMNILEHVMSKKFKKVISYITQFLGIAMGIVYIVTGMRSLNLNKGYVMSIMGFDEMWRYVPVVVCGVLLVMAAVFNLIEFALGKNKTEEDEE